MAGFFQNHIFSLYGTRSPGFLLISFTLFTSVSNAVVVLEKVPHELTVQQKIDVIRRKYGKENIQLGLRFFDTPLK